MNNEKLQVVRINKSNTAVGTIIFYYFNNGSRLMIQNNDPIQVIDKSNNHYKSSKYFNKYLAAI